MSENINYNEFKLMRFDEERLEFARHLEDVALCKQNQSLDENPTANHHNDHSVIPVRRKFFHFLIKPFYYLFTRR